MHPLTLTTDQALNAPSRMNFTCLLVCCYGIDLGASMHSKVQPMRAQYLDYLDQWEWECSALPGSRTRKVWRTDAFSAWHRPSAPPLQTGQSSVSRRDPPARQAVGSGPSPPLSHLALDRNTPRGGTKLASCQPAMQCSPLSLVEECFIDIGLIGLFCHKEPAPYIQSPLLGSFERRIPPLLEDI